MNAKKTRDRLKEKPLGRLLLRLLSLFYLLVVSLRRLFYRAGLLESRRLPVPVICFGNLSAGGTGKTSTVVAAALELKAAGRNPAVLLRGYKREAYGGKLVILGEGAGFKPEEAGDEAVMLFNMLKESGIPVLVCADRCKSGLAAIEKFGSDILLMDDGFQFFRLKRDRNIVLVNATAPFHRDSLLPYGDLRESPSGLSRADAVIVSHCERASGAERLEAAAEALKLNPSLLMLESMHSPKAYLNASTMEEVPLARFRGKKVVALSGIGDPESFEKSLTELKAVSAHIWRYPDHHHFTRAELSSIQATRQNMPLITTYKDFARFPSDWRKILGDDVYILSVEIVFPDDGLAKLMELIQSAKPAPRKRKK